MSRQLNVYLFVCGKTLENRNIGTSVHGWNFNIKKAHFLWTAVELYHTDGSQGAAKGAGVSAGIYKKSEDAFVGLESVRNIEPNEKIYPRYQEAYYR